MKLLPHAPDRDAQLAATGVRALTLNECVDVLRQQRLCVLAVDDDGQPYAIPMFYGFDDERGDLLIGISAGRKTALLDRNARLCVTVTETGPGDGWRSVVITGSATWVVDAAERETAVQAMIRHNRRFAPAASAAPLSTHGAPPPRRHSGGRMLRIADALVSGRAKSAT